MIEEALNTQTLPTSPLFPFCLPLNIYLNHDSAVCKNTLPTIVHPLPSPLQYYLSHTIIPPPHSLYIFMLSESYITRAHGILVKREK